LSEPHFFCKFKRHKLSFVHIRQSADRLHSNRIYSLLAGRRLDPERALAFAMGLHDRLGRASSVGRLDDALARLVLHGLGAVAVPRLVAL
jgi:hypothetical protein